MRAFLFVLASSILVGGQFSTSLGDSYPYQISAITTDSAGNTYVVGSRQLGGGAYGVIVIDPLPVASSAVSGNTDVFVSKLDPTGKLLFTDTFAGKGTDAGTAIALDPSGNIYIAGTTTSPDFPLSKPLQSMPNINGTGFIVKLSNDGSTILYSTYFGASLGVTSVKALTTGAAGNLYLTGSTTALDFPVTSGMPSATTTQDNVGSAVAFVTAISAAGDKILFSGTVGNYQFVYCPATVFGCSGDSSGNSIALDAAGNIYFGGNTIGSVSTTPGALVSQGLGAFVGKINANGAGLAYLTYLGSAMELGPGYFVGTTQLSSLTVDPAGNTYLGGTTGDPKFPVTAGAYQTTFAGGPINQFGSPANTDGFLAKLNPTGTAFVWATYLGGSGNDAVNSIAVDPTGDVWATGTTASANFLNKQGWSQGDDFLVELTSSGSGLSYSARYPNGTVDQSVALDSSGLIHAAGPAGFVSAINATAAATTQIFDFQNVFGGSSTARISPAEVISIYGPNIGPATAASAAPAAGFYPTTFDGVQVQINGVNIPLLYVSTTQINAVVPMGLTPNAIATVRVINGSNISPGYPVWVVPSAPQAFPTVLNQNGTVNSQTNPAKGGSYVTFYATGWQSNFSPLADGEVATSAQNECFACSAIVQNVTSPTVAYGGAAPGIVAGVTQFNIALGTTPATGGAAASVSSPTAGTMNLTIWVTP